MEIPVYVFTGLLESGKTSFLRDILKDPDFTDGEHSLLLTCEEGLEELSTEELGRYNAVSVPVDTQKELNSASLRILERKFRPDRVLIEYNGMWPIDDLFTGLPENWVVYQIVTTVNAETFEVYSNNLGPRMFEHITTADLVVFNRCTPALKEMLYNRNIRAMNPRATIFLDDLAGNTEDYSRNMPLPFDINAPVIEIADTDFGLWYVDAMGDPDKYDGKTVSFTAAVYRGNNTPAGSFVPGRFGMVCCADDISFIGFLCRYDKAETLKNREWVHVTASITVEALPQYRGENAPVLHAIEVKPGTAPKDEVVTFN